MYRIDPITKAITMHRGDTGAFTVTAARASGADWTDADRMIFTVATADKTKKIERYYRLDDGRTATTLPAGKVLVELHNGDTDTWANGQYQTEIRFVVNAVWTGEAPEDDMVSALSPGVPQIVDGVPVRVVIQSTMTLNDVYGEV